MQVLVRERAPQRWLAIVVAATLAATMLSGVAALSAASPARAATVTETYDNPLPLRIPGDGLVESCADPSVVRGQEAEGLWFMYCTADPLNDEDRNADGGFNFRLIPMFSSADLVNWTYHGDAFTTRPAYATPDAGIWAPEIEYYPETGNYHLYYTVTNTSFEGGGSAIGVATGPTAFGPWTHSAAPVIEPHPADCCPGSRRWVFDPEVFRTAGPDYIYYGSYFGGVSVRVLSESGLTTSATTQTNVAIANKYEGPEVIFRGGYYYLFLSATDCCRGPLTGYSVFVGRSRSPTGPFLDRDGVDLNDNEGPNEADPTTGRAGGTPVLTMNGNRWVGTGHNTVFQAFDGQWWTIYHAIDRFDPYFAGGVNIFPGGCGHESQPPPADDRCGDLNKRPALLDPVDWQNGWPVVRGGYFASDHAMPAPAAQPGETDRYVARFKPFDRRAGILPKYSTQFNGKRLPRGWTWDPRGGAPATGTYGMTGRGAFRFDTQAADIFVESNNASVLSHAAPRGNYMVETRVRLNVPAEGCCFNFSQAGLVIYRDYDNFVKLVHVSIFNTRQTEFAKEVKPVPAGYPRYGNTVVGPPNLWTYLRIVKRTGASEDHYTAYTSRDGKHWVRGGTWTHNLGSNARIGVVSMGGAGFTAHFDYLRVYRLHHRR